MREADRHADPEADAPARSANRAGGAPKVRLLTGPARTAALRDVAALRIEILREYPYLYAGDPEAERKYLLDFAATASSAIVGAFDGERLVGAATGVSLAYEKAAWKAPFLERRIPADQVFYFGESVLQPAFRGLGVGTRFFELREAEARRQGARLCAFLAVVRPEDDLKRGVDRAGVETYWRALGYAPLPDAIAELEWREVGADHETPHQMQYWTREL